MCVHIHMKSTACQGVWYKSIFLDAGHDFHEIVRGVYNQIDGWKR